MTDMEDIKKDVAEIRADLRAVMTSMSKLETGRAVADERQIETSKKLDMLTLAMSNNYTSAVEFGSFKGGAEDRIKKLEGWLTWILRLMVGSVILAVLAALRLKGGI